MSLYVEVLLCMCVSLFISEEDKPFCRTELLVFPVLWTVISYIVLIFSKGLFFSLLVCVTLYLWRKLILCAYKTHLFLSFFFVFWILTVILLSCRKLFSLRHFRIFFQLQNGLDCFLIPIEDFRGFRFSFSVFLVWWFTILSPLEYI